MAMDKHYLYMEVSISFSGKSIFELLTCMSGTSPGNMRSKHTSLIYFPTCTGDLIYRPFHWCVCDAFGVPQPDAWPGMGPQPFVAKTPKDGLQNVKET